MPKANEPKKPRKMGAQELGELIQRTRGVERRIEEGVLDFQTVMWRLQNIHDCVDLIPRTLLPLPPQQLAMARMWNKMFGWKFHQLEGDSQSIYTRQPDENIIWRMKATQAPVLDINFGTFEETFVKAWSLIEASQLKLGYTTSGAVDAVSLKEIIRPLKQDHLPSFIEWKGLDFSANKSNQSVAEASAVKEVPGTSILWALAYNPELLKSLHKLGVHRVWMPGCRFHRLDPNVPTLNWDCESGTLELGSGHTGHKDQSCTIPKFVDSSSW